MKDTKIIYPVYLVACDLAYPVLFSSIRRIVFPYV